jgi:hypothetical protein
VLHGGGDDQGDELPRMDDESKHLNTNNITTPFLLWHSRVVLFHPGV